MKTYLFATLLLLTQGCSAFKHSQSYDDIPMRKTPTYMGSDDIRTASVAHSAVLIDPYTKDDPFFPQLEPTLRLMADSLTRYLDSWSSSERLDGSLKRQGRPRVFAGVPEPGDGDFADVPPMWSEQPGQFPQVLRTHQPSSEWREWAVQTMEEADADHLMILFIGVGRYYPKQVDWKGNKVFEIGTGYRQEIPWLTALNEPMDMVQLTGVLVDRHGEVVASGMEGLLPLRTSFLASIFGVRRTTDRSDLDRIATLERADLDHHPLVWQVAVHNLHARLTNQPALLWVP
jgi:hypothetical protein